MNLYSKKQRWKIVLVIIASLIIGVSLWYTGNIVDRIKNDEKRKIEQWAIDIKSNIEQINIQDSLLLQSKLAYELLSEEENKHAKLWARAVEQLSKDYYDYSFFVEIVQGNKNIPLILCNQHGEPVDANNLDFSKDQLAEKFNTNKSQTDSIYSDTLRKLVQKWSQTIPPIEINYILNEKFRIYYSYSKQLYAFNSKIKELEQKNDSLFHDFNKRLESSIQLFPMVYIDSLSREIIHSNLDDRFAKDSILLEEKIIEMKDENGEISVVISGKTKGYIYYQNSDLVKQLSYFPYIQFGIIGLFLMVSYFLFSTFRRAEQNQVWVGMAKETAHQLGTPISSLMAWTELLKSKGIDEDTINEINKDLQRLTTVTDRFSKIGSGGNLQSEKVYPIVKEVLEYLSKRASKRLIVTIEGDQELLAMVNAPLLKWVIENIGKNSIDAMEGEGNLMCYVHSEKNEVFLDISDTGKGIPSSKFKTIFEPGFTTKQRGWGLGLSLVKRIVEEYHKGKVFVLKSETGKGTTFRISLQKA